MGEILIGAFLVAVVPVLATWIGLRYGKLTVFITFTCVTAVAMLVGIAISKGMNQAVSEYFSSLLGVALSALVGALALIVAVIGISQESVASREAARGGWRAWRHAQKEEIRRKGENRK